MFFANNKKEERKKEERGKKKNSKESNRLTAIKSVSLISYGYNSYCRGESVF